MGDLRQTEATQYVSITDEQSGLNADVGLSTENRNELYVNDFENKKLLKDLLLQLKKMEQLSYLSNKENFISDGLGSGSKAKVSQFGAVKVIEQGIPDIDDPAISIPITNFLRDINGSQDMRVNASLASPQDFFVTADPNTDIYISTLTFLISDQNAILSNFGAINELTNGCQLLLSTQETGESILADNLTTNFSFIRLCVDTPAVSDQVSAFRADNISGNSEGYSCVLKINNVFGTKFGVRLRAGTKDKLILRVRDNISGIDAFDCLTYGIKLIR